MTLDWDGKIRMDCSSPYAMASLIARRHDFTIATGNDTDADRHGIVTPDGRPAQPEPLPRRRDRLPVPAPRGLAGGRRGRQDAGQLVDHRPGRRGARAPPAGGPGRVQVVRARPAGRLGRVRRRGERRGLVPAPGRVGRGPPTRTASSWPCSRPRSPRSPGTPRREHYAELTARLGDPAYARIDAPATREQKAALARLSAGPGHAPTELAGEQITACSPPPRATARRIGGLKVITESGLVRRPAVGYRGRLQALRRVVPGARPPGPGPGRGAGDHPDRAVSRSGPGLRLRRSRGNAGAGAAR